MNHVSENGIRLYFSGCFSQISEDSEQYDTSMSKDRKA